MNKKKYHIHNLINYKVSIYYHEIPFNIILHLFILNVMQPSHKIEEKIGQRLQNQHLRGGNLLYITKMNNSWVIQMTRPLSIYRSLRGHNIIRADITIIF